MFRKLFFLLILFLLSACVTPMRLGISQAEWQNYKPDERERIKNGYYEVLKSHSDNSEKIIPDGSHLKVAISEGKVSMPPFVAQHEYTSVEFDISNGDCMTVAINEQNGTNKIAMKACYLNKTLFLDPSRYDPDRRVGSIQLHYSPIWDRGFVYQNVSSTGYVHLSNVNVAVRKY